MVTTLGKLPGKVQSESSIGRGFQQQCEAAKLPGPPVKPIRIIIFQPARRMMD